MAPDLKVVARPVPPVVVLDLCGDVTAAAETVLTGVYRSAAEEGARLVVLNLAGTEYINSAGIAVIISLLTEARVQGITLTMCGLNPHYQKIFRMVGLTQYAEVFDSEETALQTLKARPLGV